MSSNARARALGQAAGQLLVDEVDHLLAQRRGSHRGRRQRRLALGGQTHQVGRRALRLEPQIDHRAARQADGFGIGRVEHEHRRRLSRA